MGQTALCCDNTQIYSTEVVQLKPGTFKDNSSSLFAFVEPDEAPESGYFELENTTAKTIAIKVTHKSTAETWDEQPIKGMYIIKPKQSVCAYFDSAKKQIEVYVLFGESFNLDDTAIMTSGCVGTAASAKESNVPTWKKQVAFVVSCKNKNVVSRFQAIGGVSNLNLVNKGIIKDLLLLKHNSKSGVNVETNSSVAKKNEA
mmetsp:Transcript_10576/g.13730  ORF Transcript_10576/g.13730 Transcript_10576/m.13730 type:complete len:201 (+) Transcript_10576:135-737(+)